MKNENYEDIICPDWLINLCKQKRTIKETKQNKHNITLIIYSISKFSSTPSKKS